MLSNIKASASALIWGLFAGYFITKGVQADTIYTMFVCAIGTNIAFLCHYVYVFSHYMEDLDVSSILPLFL